jgi:hypothetical protein
MTQQETERKILRHVLSDNASFAKILASDITREHFIQTDPASPQPSLMYMAEIYQTAVDYFKESQGSLLTEKLFMGGIVGAGYSAEDKVYFLQLWQEIHEEDLNHNELHGLITALRERRAWRLYRDMLNDGQKKVETEGLEGALKHARQAVFNAEQELGSAAEKQRFNVADSEALDKFMMDYNDRYNNPAKYAGVKCGISAIDEATQGFTPAQLIVLLAKSGGGKSTQMLNWALHSYMKQGKSVLYFSFEMEERLCWYRHLSLQFQIPYHELKGVSIPPVELKARIKLLSGDNYFEYDVNMADPTVEYVEARINELIMTKGKPDLVVCDYVGNMYVRSDVGKSTKEYEQVAKVATGLLAIAKKYHVPVLTAQQLNREGLKETRATKETGKLAEVHQDMIASSKKLYDLATYVFYVEADIPNKLSIYRSVKMRDGGHIIPAFAQYDALFNRVFDLEPDKQEHFRRVYQCYGASGGPADADGGGPSVEEDIETGAKTVRYDGGADTFEKEDYTIDKSESNLSDEDDW